MPQNDDLSSEEKLNAFIGLCYDYLKEQKATPLFLFFKRPGGTCAAISLEVNSAEQMRDLLNLAKEHIENQIKTINN